MNFEWPVRVYYEDTDAAGIVYYANYLKYMERARTERLRALGYEQDDLMRDEKVVFAVRSVVADYLKPARFNDELVVTADFSELKRASLLFRQQVKHLDGTVLCQGVIRIACLDSESMAPRKIPSEMIERIKNGN
ncbi:MAG: tol-pal system-associated acyl-CoA thioesterase [Gammaproteobacteria bacterium]|nr:MAG: tol-pal system-associated acyl-CoA thioesterase [Gammaproteobacteria bacterium]RLA21920.1 MAG: tol-pal system-associated acyl-CoA thioesterase [Gammaproteobacteria bacterium]